MILPSKKTLRTYIGKSTGEVGVTKLIRDRLTIENKNLPDIGKNVSLQVDEMAIAPKATYVKQWDTIVGKVTHGGVIKDSQKKC